MHNINNNIVIEQSLMPQTINTVALNTGNIDMLGSETLAVVALIGNISETLTGSAKIDLRIEHAEDDGTGNPSAYTACIDDDVLNFTGLTGAGVFLSIDANTKEQKRHVIGYRGSRRFVRVTAAPTGLTTGGPIALLALKGNPSQKPVANT